MKSPKNPERVQQIMTNDCFSQKLGATVFS